MNVSARDRFSYCRICGKIRLKRVDDMLLSLPIPTETDLKEQLQHTADAFAIDMLVSKFIQGMPVVGVVGGLANPMYYRRIQQYVRLKYQKRFLMAKSA